MILTNILLFLATLAMLFYVIRYRIHVHIEYTEARSSGSHRRNRRASTSSSPVLTASGTGIKGQEAVSPALLKDLESALRNLGCSATEAKSRTAYAAQEGPADFDSLLFRAMNTPQDQRKRR